MKGQVLAVEVAEHHLRLIQAFDRHHASQPDEENFPLCASRAT